MIRPYMRWNGFCFLQAGLVGLVVDFAIFMIMISAGLLAVPAAALGYFVGALAHGALCNRIVFADYTATLTQLRERQQMLFLLSATLGLVATVTTTATLNAMGFTPVATKLAAMLASCGVAILIRRKMLLVA